MMRENIIYIKQNAEILRDYCHLSTQHCLFVLNLCELCGIRLDKPISDRLGNIAQTYEEIKEDCEAIFKKKYALGSYTVQTDLVLMKNNIANFSLQSIELINELNNLLKLSEYRPIHSFIKHMLFEQKQFLEKSYTMTQ